jgi:hypothetical protein
MLLNKYSGFGGGKKKSNSEFLSYNLMLNSGKKIRALRDKKKYSNSRVTRIFVQQHWESEYLFRKKKHSPPPLPGS